jgi:hypothetical protein
VIELSSRTRDCLHAVFPPKDFAEAEGLISEDCAESIPLWRDQTPAGLERIRLAVIRLSNGELASLRSAIREANTDWRDVLVAAGFANDIDAHRHWTP